MSASPTDPNRFDALCERSKDDRSIIVGSEIREVIQAYSIVCKLLEAKRKDHLTAVKQVSDLSHELHKGLSVAEAIARVRYALKNDPSYRESWKANIAMAIYDEAVTILGPMACPLVANKAAERFLQQLEKE